MNTTTGHGFEGASGARRAVVKVVSFDNLCVRYAATIRDDLIPLTFEVNNQNGTPVFVSIAYSNSEDGTNRKDTQLQVKDGKAIYDIPDGSYIRVRVWTQHELKLQSIQLNSGSKTHTLTLVDGEYVSNQSFDSAVKVIINLEETSLWGVQRDTV